MQENMQMNKQRAPTNGHGKHEAPGKLALANLKITRGQAELVMNQLSPLLKPYDATVSVGVDHFGRGYAVIVFCPSDSEPEVAEIVSHVEDVVPVEILPRAEVF